jgi:hypothetical protein
MATHKNKTRQFSITVVNWVKNVEPNISITVLWIRIRTGFGRIDPDPGGQSKNDPQNRKNEEISCFKVLDALF